LLAKMIHQALNQFFGLEESIGNELHVDAWFIGVLLIATINAMLSRHDHGVGEQVKQNGQFALNRSHHKFVIFEFLSMNVINRFFAFHSS
jgi:hypothetical protein